MKSNAYQAQHYKSGWTAQHSCLSDDVWILSFLGIQDTLKSVL